MGATSMKAMTPWARWARVGMAALVVLAVRERRGESGHHVY